MKLLLFLLTISDRWPRCGCFSKIMRWKNLSELGDLDWEGRVVSAHHKLAVMERRMLAGDRLNQELWKRCDWDFHHALISACGSGVLLETHALIYDRYLRYQMIAVVFRGEIAAREHQQLLECALARDSKRAQAILVYPYRWMR